LEIDRLAEILHNCGIDAYSGPSSQSSYDWDIWRENLAKSILNICDVQEKSSQQTDSPDSVSHAVPDKCPECSGVFRVIETHSDHCSHRR